MVIPIIDAALKVFDKVFTSPEEKAKAQLELMKLQQAGEFKQIEADLAANLAQIEVNKVEAANGSVFVSGWRPATGWVCVIGLLYNFLLQPLFGWLALVKDWQLPPDIPMGDLMILLGGLLGLAGLRTSEKKHGVAKD